LRILLHLSLTCTDANVTDSGSAVVSWFYRRKSAAAGPRFSGRHSLDGASLGFNRQWTMITGIRRRGETAAWEFACGCGHISAYDPVRFSDCYFAAVTARNFHTCPELKG
jgi:hypothetical protein